MIEKCACEDVDSWKHHPVTQALLSQLKGIANRNAEQLVAKGAIGGEPPGYLNALAGRCSQVGDIIKLIEHAEGRQ